MKSSRPQRTIVSFVRRNTWMNDSQRTAWNRYRARFLIDAPTTEMDTSIADDIHVDRDAVFGRWAPRIMEIGSENGDSLMPMVAACLESNSIAFEASPLGIVSTMGRLSRKEVGNTHIMPANGARGLAVLFDNDSLTELWIFFTNPWHKARHHRCRLAGMEFADLVASELRPGELWWLAMGWEDHAFWQRETLGAHSCFENLHDGWVPRYEARPVTKHEAKGLAQDHRVYGLTYWRLP